MAERRIGRRADEALPAGGRHRLDNGGSGGVDDTKRAVRACEKERSGAARRPRRQRKELRDAAKRVGQEDHPRERARAQRPDREPAAVARASGDGRVDA